MSIQSEINRILHFRDQSFEEVRNKGVTVPQDAVIDDLPDYIAQIQTGVGGTGAISIVDTPDSAGGTVRTITAVDISSDTVTAAHLEQGYTAHDAEGNPITGTLSPGGGGGGLEYETGTYTPASDDYYPTISFADTHSTRPFCVIIADTTEIQGGSNDMLTWYIGDWYDAFGKVINNGGTDNKYARTVYLYSTGSNFSSGANTVSFLNGSTNTTMPYYLSETYFKPYAGSTSRFWKAGKTYKWIAVWAPTI